MLKLMLNQKQNLQLMSRARQMLMLMLMPTLMQRVKQMRKVKQIDLDLVKWDSQAATLILSITIVNNLLEEYIKLM